LIDQSVRARQIAFPFITIFAGILIPLFAHSELVKVPFLPLGSGVHFVNISLFLSSSIALSWWEIFGFRLLNVEMGSSRSVWKSTFHAAMLFVPLVIFLILGLGSPRTYAVLAIEVSIFYSISFLANFLPRASQRWIPIGALVLFVSAFHLPTLRFCKVYTSLVELPNSRVDNFPLEITAAFLVVIAMSILVSVWPRIRPQ
jgi:hypothetical protein